MRDKGYGAYRGRSPWKTFVRVLVVIVLALAIIGAGAAIYLQQFLVVSADGVYLDVPFFRQEEPDQLDLMPVITPEAPIVVDTTPEPIPSEETTVWGVAPVAFPAESLYNGEETLAGVLAAGGDCALFDMKANDGTLAYSSSAQAKYSGREAPASDAPNERIRALNETEGLYTVARVSCFRDDDMFQHNENYPLYANNGQRWIDAERIHWLAPTCFDVRAYVTAVCVELAELGFDEILLDHAGYPAQGNLHYIKKGDAYDQSRFAAVIDGFYAQVADALAEYDVKLSVVTTEQARSGQDTVTGQTPENMARFARCWVADEAGMLVPEGALSTAG